MRELLRPRGVNSFTMGLITAAAVVVVLFGLRSAQSIIIPFLLSVFVAIILSGPVDWLRQRGVPNVLAVLSVVLAALLVLVGLGSVVGGSIAEFNNRLPFYEDRVSDLWAGLSAWLSGRFDLPRVADVVNPRQTMTFISTLLGGLTGVFKNAFLILVTVILMLLESGSLKAKLQQFGQRDYIGRFAPSVRNYLGLKTIISLFTGLLVTGLTAALGVDFPLLWGLLAFLLNYIPNIGSIIAAIPAVLVALIQTDIGTAVWLALGYAVINVGIGNFIEPRVMGKGLGLSVLVVFLSLVFWGWVFGPVGMLLSVPLTMILKLAFESGEGTQKLAALLGNSSAEHRAS